MVPSQSPLYATDSDTPTGFSDVASFPGGGQHEILPIFSSGATRPENYVHSFRVAGKSMFKCTWPQCPRGLFRQAEKALDHVCGHIQVKQFRCTWWETCLILAFLLFILHLVGRYLFHPVPQSVIVLCNQRFTLVSFGERTIVFFPSSPAHRLHSPKRFARKDYLKVHETRCASTHHLNQRWL